jgi:shikimate 5-dehydrogenase
MAANYKFELVGVLGFPVAENPTCVMQEAAFAALGLPWRYLTIEVKPGPAARRDSRRARPGHERCQPDHPAQSRRAAVAG